MSNKKKITLSKKSKEDIKESHDWYEEKQEGLGEEFEKEVKKTIDRIINNPEQFPKVNNQVRRALTDKFDHGIFFFINKIEIWINRVLHTSRNPKLWNKKEK